MMSIKRSKPLLFVGGAYADIPLIKAAKTLGFHVSTTGLNQNSPGHCEADEYYPVDYADHSAILDLAKRLKIEAICPGCNDFCGLAATYVAEHLKLPGYDSFETAQIIHHKDAYRKFATANNIPTPVAQCFTNSQEALAYLKLQKTPMIVKPVDLGSGSGITKIEVNEDAGEKIATALTSSKAKRIVIEEFLEGTRHGLSCLLKNGKVVFSFFDDEHYFKNPYLVSGASSPSSVSEFAKKELIEQSETIAERLSLVDGLFHVQFIVRDDQPFIIEICRRPPGDWYPEFVKHATSVDYPLQIVKSFTNPKSIENSQTITTRFFLRHCIMSEQDGQIAEIEYSESILANVKDNYMVMKKGDQIADHMTQRLGIVFIEFESAAEMQEKAPKMQELIKVKVS